jgi:SNF2 family DNA or RNA helicase
LQTLQGMSSSLRGYQAVGAQWLLFLVDNGFGGLLCDDMGLGKTHQVLALLLALREQRQESGPFLVVCPATVLSHWHRIIRDHAPGLEVKLYYEQGRDLETCGDDIDVVLTSYGILRRDSEQLAGLELAVAVFDEAQYVKNPQTAVHQAARSIVAGSKIALTGTPIENSLTDLKALFDLTLPGYLGSDAGFARRFVTAIESRSDQARQESLKRLVEPFILRRLKTSVLDELPPKIEDVRTCNLSEDQIKLYRDAVSSRRGELLRLLRDEQEQIPYIHIFALLGLLKQICDHPALVAGTPQHFEEYQSGKWDLFKELLRESLESDQKVVVYSQYLGMIRIIETYLKQLGIGFVKLTGASRKRGEIIDRFNTDPACRVFVGSLLAGGIGIDLVAASVVIHYDRWWNAAREDQATDRVHRIGQSRGVQVFKLVTEGTLEEKIAALINKKKTLMESIVKEDDKAALKTFSRQELIELLELP